MKLLVFGDMHGSIIALKKVEEKAKHADLLVCTGDVSIFEQNLRMILHRLDSFNKKILMIHGNHEDEYDMRRLCETTKNIVFMHEKFFVKNNHVFLGYGGGGFSQTEPGMKRFLKGKHERFPDKKLILFTHAPPYKTALDNILGSHCGVKTLRQMIEKLNPQYCFSGHLHENFGKKDRIGVTEVINSGPFGIFIHL